MEEITYRKAGIEDVQLITEMRIMLLSELNAPQKPAVVQELRNNLEAYFTSNMEKQTHICWLSYAGNEIAGIGGMNIRENPGNFVNLTGRIGYIINMYTKPEYRKKGICNKILNLLIQSGEEIGIKLFELNASKEGEPIYVKNGFIVHYAPHYRKLIQK